MGVPLESKEIEVDGLRLHYLEGGSGAPVLLLHGWPTSSFLWRNVGPVIAQNNRVIALDLPGYGRSGKPMDVSYSFRYFNRVLDGFLDAIGVDTLGIVVHDLGGQVGTHWTCQNPDRVTKLGFMNTLLYPELSYAVYMFVFMLRTPGFRDWITSPSGVRFAMRLGIHAKDQMRADAITGAQAPVADAQSRVALRKAALGLSPAGMREIAEKLSSLTMPIQIVYGENDRILPDVAKTMARVQQDLPQARSVSLPHCGHFCQEEEPEKIGRIYADFFAAR